MVRKVKFEDKDVDGETMRAISVYFTAAISLFTISVLLVALDGFDLVTTFSAVAATFNNVGPAWAWRDRRATLPRSAIFPKW